MGRTLVEHFTKSRSILQELDAARQSKCDPPPWSLLTELTENRILEHMRRPDISQPLITALYLCMVEIVRDLGIKPCSVIGRSSGEITAAYSASLLDRPGDLRATFYGGQGMVHAGQGKKKTPDMRMLAIGLSAESAAPFLAKFEGRLSIACYNSPEIVKISGNKNDFEALSQTFKTASQFMRLSQNEVAYHLPLVKVISKRYLEHLETDAEFAGTRNFVQGTHSHVLDGDGLNIGHVQIPINGTPR